MAKLGRLGGFTSQKNQDHHAWVHIGNVVKSKMTPPTIAALPEVNGIKWEKMG